MEIKDTRIRAIFENTSSAPFLDQIKDVASYLASNHNLNDPSILELCREAYQRRGRAGIHFLQGVQFWLKRILEEKGVEVPVPVEHLERLVLLNSQGDSWTEEPDETEEDEYRPDESDDAEQEQDETEENDLRDGMPSDADDYGPEEEEETLQPLAENVISEYVHQESTKPFNWNSLFNGVDPFENRASGKAVPLQAPQNDPVTTSEPQAEADTSSVEGSQQDEGECASSQLMSDDEIKSFVKQIMTYDPKSLGQMLGKKDFRVRPKEWFWKEMRIPAYSVVPVTGDGGIAKSTILRFIAGKHISKGDPFPGEIEPRKETGSTLFFTQEDDAADTLIPEFESFGGNVDAHFFTYDQDKMLNLLSEEGLCFLIREIQEKNAKLVIFDPIKKYFRADPKMKLTEEETVLFLLSVLGRIAKRLRCNIAAIVHTGKNTDQSSVKRVRGTAAWTELPRTVIHVGLHRDDQNQSPATVNRRVVSISKSNCGGWGKTIEFLKTPRMLDGKVSDYFEWGAVRTDVSLNDTVDRGLSQVPRTKIGPSEPQRRALNAVIENGPMSKRDFKLKFGEERFDNFMRSVDRLVTRGLMTHDSTTDTYEDTEEGRSAIEG